MWESPINVMEIQEPIIEQLNNEREEMVLKQIWKIGVDVDKEELIKALQYDRKQYEKGYSDGYAKAVDEFVKEIEAEYDNDGCPNVADYLDYKISIRDLLRIAEQLKQ